MRSFADNGGRTWSIAVNFWTCRQVRDRVGVDLFKLIENNLTPLADLLNDPVKFCDVLFVLASDQAKAAGVTDEQFGRSLGGDSYGQAQTAFFEALIDFFPDARARDAMRKILTAARRTGELLVSELEKTIPENDSGSTPTKSPEPPEPTSTD